MIIKRKYYSLHNTPAAKKVAKAVYSGVKRGGGVLENLTNGVRNLFIKPGTINAMKEHNRHLAAEVGNKQKAIRAGVNVGRVVDNPGRAVREGTEFAIKNIDTQILPIIKTGAGLTLVSSGHPAHGGALIAMPMTVPSIAITTGAKKLFPSYKNAMDNLGKKVSNSKKLKKLDKYDYNYLFKRNKKR